MDITCPECGESFDVEDSLDGCPNCGFSAETCDHPQEYRDSHQVYDAGDDTRVVEEFCGKCGMNVREM